MKKILTTLILLNFCLLFTLPVSAQRAGKVGDSEKNIKQSVKFSSTGAFSDGNGVWLEWETAFESGNLGFNIYRVDGGKKELLSPSLIPGTYLRGRESQFVGDKYNYFDPNGTANSAYIIETLSTKGQKNSSDVFSAKYVPELNSVAGSSSELLQSNESERTSPFIVTEAVNVPSGGNSTTEANASQINKDGYIIDDGLQASIGAQAGVKIGVKKEGLYRVSRDQLTNAGFDVNSPSNFWQLYKNGVEQSINIGEKDSYIEFYGTGLDNRDTDTQNYFLVPGTRSGNRIRTAYRRPYAGNVLANSYPQSTIYKERTAYADILNGDDLENFFGRTISPPTSPLPATINFNLTAIDFSTSTSSIDVKIQGITEVTHQTKVTLNNTDLGFINGNYKTSMSSHFDVPTSLLHEGTNTLVLITQGGAGDYSLFDTLSVNYSRSYQSRQNQLSFYLPNYKAAYVDGFASSNVRVFDISNGDQLSIISNLKVTANNSGGYKVFLPSNRGSLLFAVEDSAILAADSVAQNFPSALATTTHNPDMIIISYKDWMDKANDWANYRRGQGMNVEVVNVEDVYDEFSFGTFSTNAIGSFLKYAYNNWQSPPKYVLLLGDGTYNPRNYSDGIPNSGAFNFVPTKIIETLYIETGSDEAMADFNNDGLAEIPIGRIPVHSGQNVTDVLNKEKVFEQTVSTRNLSRGVVFTSDEPNGYDFSGVSSRLRDQLSQSVPTVMINKVDSGSRSQLLTELNNGRFLFNYSGHGNASAWSASPILFNSADVSTMTNNVDLPIFTMLTCLNGYFVVPSDSLSELLIKKPTGGAVAVWASTGLTTPDIQEIMATRFFSQINAGNFARMGDLIKDAKTAIPGGRDVRLSWALIGDPTLKIK